MPNRSAHTAPSTSSPAPAGGSPPRAGAGLVVFAWVHFVLVAVAAMGWVWSAWWHAAAVGAMSEQLVRDGVVDAAALPAVIHGYPSLGVYLGQGWDGLSLGWGYALCLIALVGSLGIAVAATIRRRG